MNNYLEEVSKNIKNKTAQKAVAAELEAHIEEKKAYYIEIGYSEKEAEEKAIEEMGEAEEAAVSLNALHSEKWYKSVFNLISVVLLLLCFVTMYFVADNSVYLTSSIDVHSLWVDLLSLGVFVTIVVLFVLSDKYDNKIIPSIFLAVTVLILLTVWIAPYFLPVSIDEDWYDAFYPVNDMLTDYFKPLVFALIVFFTKGFFEYSYSLHGYDYAELFENDDYQWIVLLVWALLIIWAVIIILKALCKERMYNFGIYKLFLNTIKYPMVLICTVVLLINSFGTVYSYLNRSYIIEENSRLQEQIIDFVVKSDIRKYPETLVKEFENMDLNFKKIPSEIENEQFDYQKFDNSLRIEYSVNSGISSIQCKYTSDLSYSRFENIDYYNDTIYYNEEDFAVFKVGMSIDDFMKSKVCYDAVLVEHTSVLEISKKDHRYITFYYETEKEGEIRKIAFYDDKLKTNEFSNSVESLIP